MKAKLKIENVNMARKASTKAELMEIAEDNQKGQTAIISRIIILSQAEYDAWSRNLLQDKAFIEENIDLMFKNDEGWHCLLVKAPRSDEGILVESEGYGYARYTAFIDLSE